MLKRFLLIALCLALTVAFASCGQRLEGEEAWDKFIPALEMTSSLEYYSISTSKTVNSVTTKGKLLLSADDYGRTVAYREDGNVRAWWLNGIAYIDNGDAKVKKAQSINSFLDISQEVIEWTYDMVTDVALKGNKVTFGIFLAGYDQTKVTAQISGNFLSEVTVSANKTSDGANELYAITYIYENPGQKPAVELPQDLSEFSYSEV